MSQQELEQKISEAVFAAIVSLIPWYFKICKTLLFIVALVFGIVIVGLMVSGTVLLSALKLARSYQVKKRVGVSA